MQCLVVGGTGFLGGAIVDCLAAAGHCVDVLSRGETRRKTPDNVTLVQANRYEDLSPIKSKHYDWVFDTCAFSPDAVNSLLEAVGNNIERYIFISSLSAYGKFEEKGITEELSVQEASAKDLALAQSIFPPLKGSAPAYGSAYGPLKRSCEIVAEKRLGKRATSLRVGLLIGAGDYTDRLGYWVRRIDEAIGDKTQMIAPAPKNRLVQLIDVRDIADFALLCATDAFSGIFNVTSTPMHFNDVIDAIVKETASTAEILWVTDEQVTAAEISPWTDIPMMVPDLPAFEYFFEVDASKATTAGLTCRPLSETLGPLIEWDRTRRDAQLKCGLTPEMESKLLNA